MYEQFMADFTYKLRESCLISYIFPATVVLRTLFFMLNICYDLTILV